MIEIYTDGATSKNGSENAYGGAAFIVYENGKEIYHEIYTKARGATNQQMELLAIATACEYMSRAWPNTPVSVFSDSAYAMNCKAQKWYKNWQRNGWKNASKQPVANKELWERIIPYYENNLFTFIKVKGHDKDERNNAVDKLAVYAKERAKNG